MIIAMAREWDAGRATLPEIRANCTGAERHTAVRFVEPGSDDKAVLMRLIDALVNAQPDVVRTQHGHMSTDDLFSGHVLATTNHDGQRVLAWPLYFMDGEPHYPPVHLPRGQARRDAEAAMMVEYRAYRDKQDRCHAD